MNYTHIHKPLYSACLYIYVAFLSNYLYKNNFMEMSDTSLLKILVAEMTGHGARKQQLQELSELL